MSACGYLEHSLGQTPSMLVLVKVIREEFIAALCLPTIHTIVRLWMQVGWGGVGWGGVGWGEAGGAGGKQVVAFLPSLFLF